MNGRYDSASLDWTRPRAKSFARRAWDAARDVADAVGLFFVLLALAPFLWLCCLEERRRERGAK